MKEVVTEDFNKQQLVIAKYAARQITHSLAMLQKELHLLGQAPALQYQERIALVGRLESAFMSVKDNGAIQIRFVPAPGTLAHVYGRAGYRRARALRRGHPLPALGRPTRPTGSACSPRRSPPPP